jgi:hypothetical protein
MNYAQTLEDFSLTFSEYLEFEDENDFTVEVGCLRDFYEENYTDWDRDHEALYWSVERLVDEAKAHFDEVSRQEQGDMERDERSYLGSEGNS